MKKVGVLFALIFLTGFVIADTGGWDEFAGDNWTNGSGGSAVDDNLTNGPGTSVSDDMVDDSGGGASSEEERSAFAYTANFYIAIGVSIVGLLVLIYLFYALFRKPKNKWEKDVGKKDAGEKKVVENKKWMPGARTPNNLYPPRRG